MLFQSGTVMRLRSRKGSVSALWMFMGQQVVDFAA
jgi:hypothetical protein